MGDITQTIRVTHRHNNPKIAQAAVKPAVIPGGLFMVIPVGDSILLYRPKIFRDVVLHLRVGKV